MNRLKNTRATKAAIKIQRFWRAHSSSNFLLSERVQTPPRCLKVELPITQKYREFFDFLEEAE
jgi:hypothetical protein